MFLINGHAARYGRGDNECAPCRYCGRREDSEWAKECPEKGPVKRAEADKIEAEKD